MGKGLKIKTITLIEKTKIKTRKCLCKTFDTFPMAWGDSRPRPQLGKAILKRCVLSEVLKEVREAASLM